MFALAATLRAAVTVGVALVAASAGVAQEKAMTRWQDVDRLVDEQKYQAASELTGELLGEARAAGDEAMWTRALIKSTQLRLALHGYGRAVRFLQDEPWPETPRHRLNVGLFYGHTLRTYLQAYSWEIRKREDVAGEAGEDLKTWTLDRVVQEIEETYAGIFSQREAWGEASLGEGAAYLDPGTYPAQVRGTLRDIVSYLWVDLLADTGLWRPEAQGQTYLLDLDGLLAPPQPLSESDAALLVDPAVHPVTKVRAVLADLEAWHLGQHRPEAALEARLELLRRLRASFSTHGEDRRLLRDNLTVRLATFDRGLPWFSMGLATLAEMQRSEPDDPMALARARDTARQGQSAHPDSVGGQRCAHLVSTLERPQLSLAAMAVDGDRKRSIQISHANAESVHLRAYPVDVLSTLRGKNPRWRPNQQEVTRLLGTAPAATWTQALPATPDLRSHHTYSTPPSLPRGAYVVVASLRGDFRGSGNVMSAALFLRSDLVIASRPVGDGGELEVRTVNGPDGRPRAAEVEVMRLNWRSGGQTLVRRRSEKDGRLIFATEDWQRHRHVLIARDGDDLAVQEVYGYSSGRDRQAEPRSLVYTDRSVYRPSQDIFWKVVAYRGQDDRFRTEPGDAFDVVLRDANGEEVAKERVETNEFGSASGRFTISPGRLLGSWWIEAVGRLGTARFQVEEYKRPTFEVAVDEPTSALRLNREARLIGRADYYFGLPVSDGTARWRITREPRFPPWRWWRPAASVTPRVIAHGESAVRADGTFDVIFTPQADERLADEREVSYRYSIDVEVTDGGGETREGRRSVAVGFAAIDASLQAASPFFSAEAPIVFDIARTRLSGPAAPGEGGYRIVRLVQPDETPLPSELPATDGRGDDAFRTAGDLMRPRWSAETDPRRFLRALPDGEEVASGALRHGDDGRARLELELGGGAYRLHYRSEDDFGTPVERRMDFIVRGTEALRLPLVLAPATTSVEVGDELSLLVHSGFDRQRLVLVVEGRGGRVLRQELDATEHPQLISVPITAAERGGVSVTLATVRDHQWMRQEQRVAVPYTDRRLEVSFERFRDKLRPGAEETFSVVVRGAGDSTLDPAAVELLAYMYDRSLDLFARHAPPNVVDLYPNFLGARAAQTNLGQAPIVWQRHTLPRPSSAPNLLPAVLRYLDGWPIGGPGQRRARLQTMKMATRSRPGMAAPASPLPSPAPQAEAIAVTAEAASDDIAMDLRASDASAGAAASDGASDLEAQPVRTNFAETAFWLPQLRLDADGSTRMEFTVPDSVTEWSVWAHALSRDLRGGSTTKSTRSVKDLLIRPYLPRFLRAGDRAQLKLVISNAGDSAFVGRADVSIVDPESGEDLLESFQLKPGDVSDLAFEVEPGQTATLTVPLFAPSSPRPVSITASARAGELSDGERRPLPVLPSRLHLAQSRFAAVQGPGSRTLRFEDLAHKDDPSLESESLVITVDGQLFQTALRALPYLVEYPYRCTEQTLNRYLSTGILSSLYGNYPSVAAMGARLAKERETLLEPWREDDPNRRLLLEESPWLQHARGGGEPEGLLKILDPEVAEEVRSRALDELRKVQTSSGGFPWWPGGPPSPYMTLYTLQGFARGLEFGLDVPKDMTVAGWRYLERYWREELGPRVEKTSDCCAPRLTFYAWLLWAFPDPSWTGDVFSEDDRRSILEQAAAHWRSLSPRLKGYLTLALVRAGEMERARLVWDSVMDSAKTEEDLGTFWAPEDQAWLWYNDTVESQAFALRVLMALDPDDPRRHGLVQWLLLDKKLGHWKSTRATAEAVYALAAFLSSEGTLGAEQRARVSAGPVVEDYVFRPEDDGRRQRAIEGPGVKPSMSRITVENHTPGLLFASATWHFATDRLPPEAEGDFFSVERSFFKRELHGDRWRLVPLAEGEEIAVGDSVEVRLQIRAKHAAEYVQLRDPRGAGFEPEDVTSGFAWDSGLGHYREIRDSAVNYFFEWLPAGEYTFRYRIRATTAGAFRVGPAQLQSMYAPEFVAYSSGQVVSIEE